MIPVKVQCGCGQRYTFDVEPVGGRLSSPVACPVCGADGTAAANAAIAQSLSAQPAAVVTPGAPLRVALRADQAPSHPPSESTRTVPREASRFPGQVDRPQAEHEARAKVSWGEPPAEVTKYLMVQGFSYEEASSLVQEMFRERAATIRTNGIKKILLGVVFMCLPVAVFLVFMSIGVIYVKILAITIMIGFWGLWMVIKGIFMVVAPKSEGGDVAEQ